MKRMLFCLILCCLCLYCCARPQENIKEQSDTTIVEKTIDQWVDSLNTRNFSEDAEKLKEDINKFGDKAKKSIERHTPKVKKLMKEFGDYLKR